MGKASINHDLSALTDAERLWLWRYRKDMTQPEAAKLLGCSLRTYQGQERGTVRLWGGYRLWGGSRPTNPLTPAEWCALARRRAAWTCAKVAKRLHTSRVTLLRDESQGAPALVAFWRKQGFKATVRRYDEKGLYKAANPA